MSGELILVDTSGYVFRTHYALMHVGLTSPDGKSSHIIMGVLNMLDRLQKQYPDASIVAVLDGKGKGVRAKWDSNYKANRPVTPPEIKEQLPPLKEVIKARGIPLLVEDEVEADDIIATLTEQAKPSYERIIIVSADKDLAQLVEDGKVVMLSDDKKNVLLDGAGVREKWNVPPELIPDYLSLIGDKVDNIPGVEKAGPKTATSWLEEYGSLQGVMDNADSITGKIGENLRAALPHLPLSLKMNTLMRDLKLPMELAEVQKQLKDPPVDTAKLAELYRQHGLKRLLESLGDAAKRPTTATTTQDKPAGKVILEEADWQALLAKLGKSDSFAMFPVPVSAEAEPVQNNILGLAFALARESAYLPCQHSYQGAPNQLKLAEVLKQLAPLFADPKKNIICHDVKLLGHLLLNNGINPPVKCDDTMLMSYISNSSRKHEIGALSEMLLQLSCQSLEDLRGKGKKKLQPEEVEVGALGTYACEMVSCCLELHKFFGKEFAKAKPAFAVYQELDLPLVPILLDMERRGALLDTKILAEQSKSLKSAMVKLQAKAYKLAGEEFNLSSPAQLKTILFDKMGLAAGKKTSGGQLSTSEDVLQDLVAAGEELPEVILEYRGISKLKNTYTDALPLLTDANRRVHTSFNQAVASTGRLSSANPNLQNIPIRDEAGRKVRAAFIPPSGMVLASADYSQIELRIMAHLSGDKSLLAAFAAGQDVHQATAAEIFGVPLEDIDREQRRRAKIANFGLIYGMGPYGLARQLYISNKEAQKFVEVYFARYPGVKKYMDDTRDSASKSGWAETLSGRKVYLPHINSSNFAAKQAAMRAAINAPVQGSSADLIKLAMLKLAPQLKEGEANMILQVHDELVFEIREDLVDKYKPIICQAMEAVQPLNAMLKVPLLADFGVGANWKEAH